jgi:hypothetical protein
MRSSQWSETDQKWYFSIVDVVGTLTESVDPLAYWRKLKERLKKEGNETVTNCHGLKIVAADGKIRMTDVAATEQFHHRKTGTIPGNAEQHDLYNQPLSNYQICLIKLNLSSRFLKTCLPHLFIQQPSKKP